VYCPKIVASRERYDDQALESRFITHETDICTRTDIPTNLPNEFHEEAKNLRNKLLLWRLRNYRKKTEPDVELKKMNVEPRLIEIMMPLSSVIENVADKSKLRKLVHQYQEDIADPVPEFGDDVAFTGALDRSVHHGPRTRFVEELRPHIQVTVYPTPHSGNTRFQTPEQSASAKAILGFQMGEDIPLYLDVRPFQYIGAGALFFHDRSESMKKFFVEGSHYIAFERNNVKDFLEKYNHYVNKHPEEGRAVRRKGFDYCQRFHSAEARIRFVFDVLEGRTTKPRIYLNDIGPDS